MSITTIHGCFFFKASHAQELMEEKPAQTIHVEVVKGKHHFHIELTPAQFQI